MVETPSTGEDARALDELSTWADLCIKRATARESTHGQESGWSLMLAIEEAEKIHREGIMDMSAEMLVQVRQRLQELKGKENPEKNS